MKEKEDFEKTIDSLSHAVEDDEDAGGSGRGYVGHPMEDDDDDSDGEGLVIQEDEDADAEKGDDGTDGGGAEGGVSPDSRLDSSKAGEKEESPKAEEKALEEMPVPSGKTDKNKAITDEILKD